MKNRNHSGRNVSRFLVLSLVLWFGLLVSGHTIKAASLSQSYLVLAVNQSVKLKASGLGSRIRWSSSSARVAEVKNGKVTAKGVGSCTIKASGKKKSCTCKVKVGRTLGVSATDVTLTDEGSVTVYLNKAGKISWTLDNCLVAEASAEGFVGDNYKISLDAVSSGSTMLHIRNKSTGEKIDVRITVKKPRLSEKNLQMEKGNKKKLKLIDAVGKVKWSSSNKKVATVSSKGTVKAKKNGKAVITAKSKGKTYRCTVTVKEEDLSNQIGLKLLIPEMDGLNYYCQVKVENKTGKTITIAKSFLINGKRLYSGSGKPVKLAHNHRITLNYFRAKKPADRYLDKYKDLAVSQIDPGCIQVTIGKHRYEYTFDSFGLFVGNIPEDMIRKIK